MPTHFQLFNRQYFLFMVIYYGHNATFDGIFPVNFSNNLKNTLQFIFADSPAQPPVSTLILPSRASEFKAILPFFKNRP